VDLKGHKVAVIGAGPAGLYAVNHLSSLGVSAALLNRDIKPGGLAEYGIFHKKHKMKSGLRKQFRTILDEPNVHYFGNIKLGEQADISLEDLRELGFSAILFTVGAQNMKSLGLPGEDLGGVYHAKEIVSHFNLLPPYSTQAYPLGDKVAIIGVGNVMVDITNLAIHSAGVRKITAVARRSAADVKFSRKEFSSIYSYLDTPAFNAEIERITGIMHSAGQDVNEACTYIHSAQSKAEPASEESIFNFRFLSQPVEIVGDENGRVRGLLLEDTTLKLRKDGGKLSAVGLGTKRLLECDSVVLCIGNDHEPELGLPMNKWNEFAAAPNPRFPINGISYESYAPQGDEILSGIFVAGWAREPNKGLVGNSRKDGINAANAITEYLHTLPAGSGNIDPIEALRQKLDASNKHYIDSKDLEQIETVEQNFAHHEQLKHYKFKTNEEMLSIVGKNIKRSSYDRRPVAA